MVEYPFATVGGLIVAPDGTVLLVQSKKWSDLFSVPGGKIELRESREEAFHREIWEETRLKVVNLRFAQGQESIFSPEFWRKSHFVMSDFIADLDPTFSKDQVQLNDEAYAYCWVQPEEALKLPLQHTCKGLIEWYLANSTRPPMPGAYGNLGFTDHEISCIIGIYPEERKTEQLVSVDLKVEVDLAGCFASGSIGDTVDYSQLAALCSELAQKNNYQLLETFASDILDQCLRFQSVRRGWVRIKKPASIPSAAYAYVELERRRRGS